MSFSRTHGLTPSVAWLLEIYLTCGQSCFKTRFAEGTRPCPRRRGPSKASWDLRGGESGGAALWWREEDTAPRRQPWASCTGVPSGRAPVNPADLWRGPSDPPRRTHPLRVLHMPTCKKPPYADHAGICVLGELLSLMLLRELRPGEMAQARRVTTPRVFSTRPRDRDGLFWPGLVSGVWVVR